MTTVSLFQKYRSQNFDDLVGQDVVVHTLKNALSSGNPARAYLFCGPRGTGKTSTARILAKALNCEHGPTPTPCCECRICQRIADGSCLDVMEIDAASHTQVDKIRDFIVDKVQFAPAEAKYKVYIIDEVHKLSTASFNALLKTLEEPPAHVVFILATTHPHELLPTILSRCQRHDFLRLTQAQICDRIKYVSGKEGFTIEEAAAEQLARSADGSLRDALVGLEQAATYCNGTISGKDVRELLGLAGATAVSDLVACMIANDVAGSLKILDGLVSNGRDLGRLCNEFLEYLRLIMLNIVGCGDVATMGLADGVIKEIREHASKIKIGRLFSWIAALNELQPQVRDQSKARLMWEMFVIRLTTPEIDSSVEGLTARVAKLEQTVAGLQANGGGVGGSVIAPSRAANSSSARSSYSSASNAVSSYASKSKAVPPEAGLPSGVAAAARAAAAAGLSAGSTNSRAGSKGNSPAAASAAPDLGWNTSPTVASSAASLGWNVPTGAKATPAAIAATNDLFNKPANAVSSGSTAKGHLSYSGAGDFWQKFLGSLQRIDPKLQELLSSTTCYKIANGKVTVLLKPRHRVLFDDILSRKLEIDRHFLAIFGEKLELRLCLDDENDDTPVNSEHQALVNKVVDMFGGKVVTGNRN